VTLRVSPELTAFDPPVKVDELNRMPPLPAVLPTVLPELVAVTNMLPVTVAVWAVPIMTNAVVVEAFTPEADADHVTVGRVARMPVAISVTTGTA
jgi:hypothetical protein